MTPDTIDTTELQQIIIDGFNGYDDDYMQFSCEGLLARSALILLWGLNDKFDQKTLDLVLRQVGEHISYLTDQGLISSDDLALALKIISGTDTGSLPNEEEEIFKALIDTL